MSAGFDSEIARDEPLFFALEGSMVLLAGVGLTAFHPGVCFQGRWQQADFSLTSKGKAQRLDSSRTEGGLALDNAKKTCL